MSFNYSGRSDYRSRTSVAFSPILNRHIGLAYVKPELATIGDRFSIRLSDGTIVTATICPTPFYDPKNLRQQEAVSARQEVSV